MLSKKLSKRGTKLRAKKRWRLKCTHAVKKKIPHATDCDASAVGANAEGCKVRLDEGAHQAPRLASSGPSDVELLATVVDERAMAERHHRPSRGPY